MSSFTSCFCRCSKSTTNRKRYDVYLSFCEEDARSFVLGIYKGLTSSEREIDVFWDDKKIRRGDREIPSSVLNVIEDCKLVVIVFSTNYFNSRWCLQELEKITHCCQTTDSLMLLTLFYDRVSISISFGISERSIAIFGEEGFDEFLDRISKEEMFQQGDKFMSWVATISHNKAITYAGSTYLGHVFTYKSKSEHIENVVELVTHVITEKRGMFNAFYTECLNSRVQDVIQLLKQSKSPLLLGIWGMPGIGKTTIAKAVYGQIGSYFAHKCLIEDVKGSSVQNTTKTLVSLQEKILFDMGRVPERNIFTIETGKIILKARLQSQRVLLVLDDVDNLEQLHALCGSRDWFGEGSKIIITTRNRQLLKEHEADHIYRVKELDENESLELFNWKAFSQETSQEGFAELSRQVVAYSGGLPLALTDLGDHFNSKPVDIWESKLHNFTRSFYNGVQGTLESSFNDLNDEEKQVFFHIAYFYIGIDQHYVLQSLNRSTQSLISLLEDKNFVTVDENNKIQMHVLLQATAEAIIMRKSSNKTDQPKLYDVFLSFRGEDSRAKFMSHLHSSLQNAGIDTFRDDDEIQRGDQISISLLKAIGQSRISIVVLSKNYANSRWCMLELEKIMEIGRTKGLVVVPVFYEVDPSDVRHQKGQFGKGFDDLTSKISVHESTKTRWQRDLYEICGIAGFVLIDSRNESADIKNIVEHVTRLLDRTQLFVAEHPVGVESRVQAATKLLSTQKSGDVLLLGIWGMGGTGKTTIAKAIFNKVGRNFEGRSFLLGIRELWGTRTNQVSIQQQVLCDVYKTTALKIRDIESGKNILKEKLSKNRVLFVLDDVDELDQLKTLCGSREWFGPGSRIIITTRDRNLLELCGVDEVYTIEGMDESESLELFSWHAFKQPSPTEDYATHSADVIAYSGKLPLALEVLGSYLSNCEITEWHKVLEKLKCIPHDQVQKKLKVSFDGLKDFTEKQIFLDIACFFIGMDKKDVTEILNGCGFFADIGIKVLVERALLTVDNRNKLRMHDLLRDMGRQIIYEESPSDPEMRSRLWRRDEVFDILAKHKGTEAVKGLALEFPRKDCVKTKAFKKMNKLRLLRLAGVKLNGDFKYLSGDLRWLYWHGFPETYVPAEFQQESLVSIELKYSKLKQIWNSSQILENLKVLNLSHSLDLTATPDFTYLPNLEKLVLKNCPSLSKISHSIGSLSKLLLINLTDCTGLRKLPRSIYKLKSLETLILSGCLNIDKLEEDLEQMESLITLIADKTGITKVPFSLVKLKSIGYISFHGFEGFSRDVFPSLIRSWMSPANNVIPLVQTSVSMSSSLGTSKDLQKLRILCVECGSELQLTQDIARILDVFKATNCQNSEASASSTSEISDMHASPFIDHCPGPVHNSGSKNHLKSLLIQMGTKCQISNVAEDSVLQTADGTWDSFLLLCDNKSDWLTFSCKGCSIIFDVPTIRGSNLKSMTLSVVYYSSSKNITSEGCQGLLIVNYTKTTIQAYKRDTLTSFEDEDWQTITSNLEPGNKVEVIVVFGEGIIVDKTTVSLLYDEPLDKEMERCHVVHEGDLIVFGNDGNNVSGSGGDTVSLLYDEPLDKTVEHCHVVHEEDLIVSGNDDNNVSGSGGDTVSLLYDEPLDKEMELCHVVDEEDVVVVSGYADNNVSGSGGDNEVINHFGEEMVNHMQITMYAGGLYADAVGPFQLVPHEPDQPAEAVAEEIPAAKANGDQEQQVPPPDGQPEQQAAAAPQAIGSALGAQILDAFREMRADFFQLEQTVTARFDAVEVRLEELEDAMAQIPRGSNSESTDIES